MVAVDPDDIPKGHEVAALIMKLVIAWNDLVPVTVTEPDVESKPFGFDVARVAVSLLKFSVTPVPPVTIGLFRLMVALVPEKPTTEVFGAIPVPVTRRPLMLPMVPT